MRTSLLALTALALTATSTGAALADASADGGALFGVWRNPKNSVHVDIRRCGAKACGYVVWASEKAKADARKGTDKPLIGMRLFENLDPSKSGVWRGKVFVPDQNRTFSGSAQPLDGKTLRAKGCLFGNVLCKSQIWTRIEEASR